MPENKDQHDVSDIVEIVRSYGNDDSEEYEDSGIDSLTDDEVREKINRQFMQDGIDITKDVKISDTYALDEDFLAEAELDFPGVTVEEPEELEEIEEPEEPDELTFDDLEGDEEEDDESIPIVLEEDEELTFDDLEENEEEDDESIPIVLEEDEELTFDDFEENEDDESIPIILEEEEKDSAEEYASTHVIEEAEEGISSMHLEDEHFDTDDIYEITHGEDGEGEEEPDVIPENFILKESRRIADEEALMLSSDEEIEKNEESTVEPSQNDRDEDVFDEIFTEDITVSERTDSPLEALAKSNADGSEISLLLQLGCEEEVIEHYDMETLGKINEEEALKNIVDEEFENIENAKKEEKNETVCKIKSRYEFYQIKRGGLLFRLALSSVFALLLFLYEALPYLFGVELFGMLNREDYFFSYVLLGLPFVILCGLPVYRSIFEGAKKLFSRSANMYSMVVALAVPVLIYDIFIIFADSEVIPPTFHFALALAIVFAVLQECQTLTAEKKSFEFYFSDILETEEDANVQKCFTLCKSAGKNSVAEKMYAGGSKSVRSLYYPIETDGMLGFFTAVNNRSKKTDIPMIMLIPSMVISLLIGVFAFIISGTIAVGIEGVVLSLLFSMPVIYAFTAWLPFERLSANFENDGFAFAGEGSIDSYSDCNMVLFNDLLIFSKCQPSKVNLALYDATSKDVLLGCLSALYSEIGGPMCETFAAAKNEKLGKCFVKRVAMSGVEAIVGTNYSVLVGSEIFMSRYGISFPNASLSNSEDEVFTLCVSINGRASARIAVRYAVNDMFLMFLHRLAEDGIECVVETFDPMISTELLRRLLPNEKTPISIVHLNAQDHSAKKDKNRDSVLFEASGGELGVVAKYSKLNLHVALSAAKRMTKLRKAVNTFAIAFSCVGALIALMATGFSWLEGFSQFYLILYWLIGIAGVFALTLKLLPSKDRYDYELYKAETEENKDQER